MKNKIFVLIALLITLFTSGYALTTYGTHSSNAMTFLQPPADSVVQSVSNITAASLMKSKSVFIIDVRTPQEFAQGHIPGAVNYDFYSASFKEQINKLDKSKSYLVYCASGRRSLNASTTMEQLGFKKIYNLKHGINMWDGAVVK